MMNHSYFDGSALGLFGYKLLAGLITGLTFGIATPWAIVILKQYEIEHTIVEGKRLQFVGTGGALFGRWLLWLLLTFITFGIYGIWANYNLQKWVAENTVFYPDFSQERPF